ncbi:hypothetical protein LguiA_004254 [Lonicera macranthoides]
MSLFSKAAITQGMNPYVFVVYRQAFAVLALAPFAFFIESKESAPLSFSLLCKIFLISLVGMTSSLNLLYFALQFTTATLVSAITNAIPVITFIMAVLLRVEKISIRKRHGITKVIGSTISLSGALVLTFIKGPPVYSSSNHHQNQHANHLAKNYSREDLIKGCLLLLLADITWSLWLIVQAPIVKQYPAKLRLTSLQCFFSCLQSLVLAVSVERSKEAWKLEWNLNLLSVVYCGVIVTGFTYWLQVWAVEKKGPVFTAIVSGAVLLVAGVYGVLWGKKIEGESQANEEKSQTKPKEETTLECITQHS